MRASGHLSHCLALAGAIAAGGCASKQAPTPPAAQTMPSAAPVDAFSTHLEELDLLVQDLTVEGRLLPGRTDREDRALMLHAFADLTRILAILGGPESSGLFRQQQQIVSSARAQLDVGGGSLAPEPTIDTGLRAAHRALVELARGGSFEQAQVAPLLERVGARVEELDNVRGTGHQWVAAQVVRGLAEVSGKMSQVLTGRGADTNPTAPDTGPAA